KLPQSVQQVYFGVYVGTVKTRRRSRVRQRFSDSFLQQLSILVVAQNRNSRAIRTYNCSSAPLLAEAKQIDRNRRSFGFCEQLLVKQLARNLTRELRGYFRILEPEQANGAHQVD